jgi:hypothetical protein
MIGREMGVTFHHPDPTMPSRVPSLYGWVEAVQIANDDLTSLQPVNQAVTSVGEAVHGQVMLFADANFRGPHKHVFNIEADLNADDDNAFNDATSSIAVLDGNWFTYRDAQFQRAYDATLGEGLFAWVEDVGIVNDDMSSLSLAGDRRLFLGTATIKISSGQVPDPVVVDVAMSFLVDLSSGQLRVENGFGPIGLLSLGTITYDDADKGNFTADGQIAIPNFHITVSGTVGGFPVSADATFPLTTGAANSPDGAYMENGSPVSTPASVEGNVALVAASNLDGDDFSIKLVGTLTALS